MNSSFPPLYPQEAYPEQQNVQMQSANQCQNFSQQNCGIGSLILPLLLKSMGGKLPMADLLQSLGGNSPLLSALSSLSDKKTPTQSVGEKNFPDS